MVGIECIDCVFSFVSSLKTIQDWPKVKIVMYSPITQVPVDTLLHLFILFFFNAEVQASLCANSEFAIHFSGSRLWTFIAVVNLSLCQKFRCFSLPVSKKWGKKYHRKYGNLCYSYKNMAVALMFESEVGI